MMADCHLRSPQRSPGGQGPQERPKRDSGSWPATHKPRGPLPKWHIKMGVTQVGVTGGNGDRRFPSLVVHKGPTKTPAAGHWRHKQSIVSRRHAGARPSALFLFVWQRSSRHGRF